jgi:hypothetical protein
MYTCQNALKINYEAVLKIELKVSARKETVVQNCQLLKLTDFYTDHHNPNNPTELLDLIKKILFAVKAFE